MRNVVLPNSGGRSHQHALGAPTRARQIQHVSHAPNTCLKPQNVAHYSISCSAASTHATCAPLVQRRAYKLASWTTSTDFLEQLSVATGKLLKGGEPDLNTTAKGVLYDWQRGRLPYFTLPPGWENPGADNTDRGENAAGAAQGGSAKRDKTGGSGEPKESGAGEEGAVIGGRQRVDGDGRAEGELGKDGDVGGEGCEYGALGDNSEEVRTGRGG